MNTQSLCLSMTLRVLLVPHQTKVFLTDLSTLFLYRGPGGEGGPPRDMGSKRLQQTQAQVDEVRLYDHITKTLSFNIQRIFDL